MCLRNIWMVPKRILAMGNDQRTCMHRTRVLGNLLMWCQVRMIFVRKSLVSLPYTLWNNMMETFVIRNRIVPKTVFFLNVFLNISFKQSVLSYMYILRWVVLFKEFHTYLHTLYCRYSITELVFNPEMAISRGACLQTSKILLNNLWISDLESKKWSNQKDKVI